MYCNSFRLKYNLPSGHVNTILHDHSTVRLIDPGVALPAKRVVVIGCFFHQHSIQSSNGPVFSLLDLLATKALVTFKILQSDGVCKIV